jgi:raffinose/stachyose/melibiose transport system permease protein
VCSTSSLTAYVLARKKIKSWKIVTFYLLATTTAPIQLYLFPLYFGFAKLGLINNVFGVALIYTALYSPFAVMLLRTYFLAVPKELEEAAIIDGATHWQVFWRVMLPIVSPGILTVALIIGLNSWNEFLIATTFLQKAENTTAVIAFYLLSGQYSSDWGEIMAAALIIVIPVVVLFVFMQKRFIEGMAGGSVKG